MKNNHQLKSDQLQQWNFVTLIDELKYKLAEWFASPNPIIVYHDPIIKTITTVSDLFQSCIMLVIKQAIEINNPNNHIKLAFFYFHQGINFVFMDRYHTYAQAPFNVLYQMPDVPVTRDHPYYHIIQSLKALKKAGGSLQMLKIREERCYPSFRFDQ